jgi:protein-S-isoprenylcysteine O-methyltransferase Ste14
VIKTQPILSSPHAARIERNPVKSNASTAGENPTPDTPKLPILPPYLYFIPFLVGVLLHHTVGGDRIPAHILPAARLLGWILVALGVVINVSAWIAFLRARTPVIPTRPTTAIVTWGPYKFTRNPLYLSLAIIYLGTPLLLGYVWPYIFFPLVPLLVARLVIRREESYLERKFGAEYTRYRDSVRRWL